MYCLRHLGLAEIAQHKNGCILVKVFCDLLCVCVFFVTCIVEYVGPVESVCGAEEIPPCRPSASEAKVVDYFIFASGVQPVWHDDTLIARTTTGFTVPHEGCIFLSEGGGGVTLLCWVESDFNITAVPCFVFSRSRKNKIEIETKLECAVNVLVYVHR